MPDYLGDDQRKTKDEKKDDKPIKGMVNQSLIFLSTVKYMKIYMRIFINDLCNVQGFNFYCVFCII